MNNTLYFVFFNLIYFNNLLGGYNISLSASSLTINAVSQLDNKITGSSSNFNITTSYTTPPTPAPASIRVTAQFTKIGNPWSSYDNLRLVRLGANTLILVSLGNSNPVQTFYTAPTTITLTNARLDFESSNDRNNMPSTIGGTLDLIAQAP